MSDFEQYAGRAELVEAQLTQLRGLGDVAIVALNGPMPDGVPSLDNELRVRHAAALAAEGGLPLHFVGSNAAANMVHALSVFPRLDSSTVTCDVWSHDTIGNAVSTREYAGEHRLHGVGIVTLGYHMPRALTCFRTVLGMYAEVVPCPPAETAYSRAQETKLRASQAAIGLYNRWQLRGLDPESPESLQQFKTLLEQSHRYGGPGQGLGRTLLRGLDRFTTGKS